MSRDSLPIRHCVESFLNLRNVSSSQTQEKLGDVIGQACKSRLGKLMIIGHLACNTRGRWRKKWNSVIFCHLSQFKSNELLVGCSHYLKVRAQCKVIHKDWMYGRLAKALVSFELKVIAWIACLFKESSAEWTRCKRELRRALFTICRL